MECWLDEVIDGVIDEVMAGWSNRRSDVDGVLTGWMLAG